MDLMSHCDHDSIAYRKKTIPFSVIRSDRKTMEIAVNPDKTIVVRVPRYSDMDVIRRKVFRRAKWIVKQMDYFDQFMPRPVHRQFINGETHFYMGKRYRIKLVEDLTPSVKLLGPFFYVTGPTVKDSTQIEKQMNQWYLEKAIVQFQESLDRCWPKVSNLGYEKPEISIRKMEKRWGSLSKRGVLTLNSNLIKTSKASIDYVVTHELCHLVHRDHSPKFYQVLSSILPDWKRLKHHLEMSFV
ncbi:M48 family peptidase [bacterium]|nr:M48 family peptidase [bacterium]